MKKKFVSIISLLLAAIMVFPVGVFADGEKAIVPSKYHDSQSEGIVVYDGGTTKNSVTLSVSNLGDDDAVLEWKTYDNSITVGEETGVVTANALTSGDSATATVYATLKSDPGKPLSANITIKKYAVESIAIKDDTKVNYVVGQKINKNNIKVEATYTDGSKGDITDFTFTPDANTALTTAHKQLTVKYTGVPDATKPIEVADVGLDDFVKDITIEAPASGKEYTVGQTIKPEDIRIKIENIGGGYTYATAENDNVTVTATYNGAAVGWHQTAGHTFGNGEITTATKKFTISVTYAGKTKSVDLTVKDKVVVPDVFTAEVVTAPTKTTYEVGSAFDSTGVKYKIKKNGTEITVPDTVIKTLSYTFVEGDIGKTSFEFTLSFIYSGKTESCNVTISGLTVKAATAYIDEEPVRITSVELKKDRYPIGYIFSLSDIYVVKAKFYKSGSTTITETRVLDYEDLIKYVDYTEGDMDLEVLDADGDRKSVRYAHKLESSDIEDDKATLLFTFGRKQYEIYIESGEPDVTFIYDGDVIAEYEDIEDALEYTREQDDDIDITIFDLENVEEDEYILIKLGKSFTFRSSYVFNPKHNVIIDLNGNSLTMASDQIVVKKTYKDCTVTITNSHEDDAGKLVYSDKDLTLTLNEDDNLYFEYDEKAPGLHIVTIAELAHGTVVANPKADSDSKIEVGHGGKVTFTITPEKGYALDYIKVGTKTVKTSDYTVSSSGVATFVLEGIEKNVTVYIEFVKSAAAEEWKNPFKDVSSNSTYFDAVKFVYRNKLFEGTSSNTFEPNTTMTRAMFVTVLGRLAQESGITIPAYKGSSYTDVVVNKSTEWYTPYVEWATQNGIVQGHGDGTFGPDEEITHQQMYVMMYRYAMFVAKKSINIRGVTITVSDKDKIADWAEDAVKYATQKSFLVTSGTKLDPEGDAKRYELAVLLQRFCKNILSWNVSERISTR